jgi:hypothetical protein
VGQAIYFKDQSLLEQINYVNNPAVEYLANEMLYPFFLGKSRWWIWRQFKKHNILRSAYGYARKDLERIKSGEAANQVRIQARKNRKIKIKI